MSAPHQARPEAAAAVWNWREPPARRGPAPTPGRLRMLGTLQALGAAAAATALYFYWSQTVGTVVYGVAAVIGFSALASPTGLYKGVQALFAALGNWTGRALTWLMLAPLFYLFFLPFGLLLRRGRRDQLKRYFDADLPSYWEPHKPFCADDHERQF